MIRPLTTTLAMTALLAVGCSDRQQGPVEGMEREDFDERHNARLPPYGNPEEGDMHDFASEPEEVVPEMAQRGPAVEAQGPAGQKQSTAKARAEVKDKNGKVLGTATFRTVPNGVMVSFEGEGLSPGTHGFHIHETGKCEGPDFKSAGGHFNPTGEEHGFKSDDGPHLGDIPNLVVQKDGKGTLTHILSNVTLEQGAKTSLFDADQSALVVHAKADDYKTNPSGASGDRIACGVIEREG